MNTLRYCHERKSPRRAVSLPCQAVAETGFRLLGEEVLDVSTSGVLIRSDVHAELGETVIVSFRAPRSQDWIDAEAIVARIVAGHRATDRGRAIGLHFVQQDAMDRIMLAVRLEKLVPRLPDRTLRRDYAGFVRGVDFYSPANMKRSGFDYLADRLH